MGRSPTQRPARLAKKLVDIRLAFELSQNEMVRRLRLQRSISREEISKYERGLRVPPLLILLRYARAAGVSMDVLVDDDLDLPKGVRLEKGKTRNRAS